MKILAINTASSQSAIAFFSDGKILAADSWLSHNDEAEKLMPAIDKLSEKAQIKLNDIQKVYVVRGPGSFTGLRIGITVANTIAYLNKTELFSISTFELWHTGNNFPVLVHAGSGALYLSSNRDSDYELINMDQLSQALSSKSIIEVTGDISDEQIAHLDKVVFTPSSLTFGQIMEKIIADGSGQAHLGGLKIIKPLYIKKPNISRIKKKTCFT